MRAVVRRNKQLVCDEIGELTTAFNTMVRDLKESLEGAKFKPWLMPVNQISGIHLQAPQFPALLTFTTVKDLSLIHI